MSATYTYGARGAMPPVKLTWYQGQMKPPQWTEKVIPQWPDGVLFVGDKGMLLSNYSKHVLLPEKQFEGFTPPAPTIPDSLGHHKEWLNACKTGAPTTCHFGYSGRLTEANHLGNVAYRAGRLIEWDTKNMRIRMHRTPSASSVVNIVRLEIGLSSRESLRSFLAGRFRFVAEHAGHFSHRGARAARTSHAALYRQPPAREVVRRVAERFASARCLHR